jgi:tetratricopeptide (TPR) repeat protein
MPSRHLNHRNRITNNNLILFIMKRILIALAVLLSVQVADAQMKSPAVVKKTLDNAEAASQDPKKNVKTATWLKLAEAYMDAYTVPAGAGWVGASKQELQLILAGEKPLTVQNVELNGALYEKESFETRDYYYNGNGVLEIIKVTKPIVENALAGALNAYAKAHEVDLKQAKTKDINAGIENISRKYYEEAMTAYTFGDYAGASKLFGVAADAAATAPLSKVDTTAIYNAGFTAMMVQDYEAAKVYLEKCLAVGYYHDGGEVYARLADVYGKLGNQEKSVEMLEQGFTQFPQSQSILIGLINYYLENNQNPSRLFELITLAKQNEPNNASLFYVEGNIYNELRQAEKDEAKAAEYLEKAVQAYDACEGVNAAYEFGHIGKGVMFYNMAIDLQEKASNELDDRKYMALVEQFEDALMKALPPFEKAYAISADNTMKVNIAEYLKNIYYRFITKGAEYEDGYKKYNEIVKTGVAQ